MVKIHKVIVLSSASTLCGGLAFGQVESKSKEEMVPFYYKITEDDVLSDLNPGYIKIMTWPSESHLLEARVDVSSPEVKRALDSTYSWLKKVIRPEWLPDLERVDLYPLSQEFDGWDVLRFRYRIGDYVFQVASLSYSAWISVAPYNKVLNGVPVNLENGKIYFTKTAPVFFLKSDAFESVCKFKPVQKGKSVININREGPGYWWETINWWTDGNAVMLLFRKDDPSFKQGPEKKPNWFSSAIVNGSK